MSRPWTRPAVPECSRLPWDMCPPAGMDGASIVSPGFENAEYTARLATTPEIGLTSANWALNSVCAFLAHMISTLSM